MSDDVSGNELEAGAYYSPKNPNKLGYNAFIPDSKGYPFSRVQYTFDNTGRTYRKAGIGPMFTMDIVPETPGHETKFYYAKPNQPELDRMFGNEVGYAIRYQKNMVVDPNGQVSVSYLNPEGKTIALRLPVYVPTILWIWTTRTTLLKIFPLISWQVTLPTVLSTVLLSTSNSWYRRKRSTLFHIT